MNRSPIRHVMQKNRNSGCGPACVAMLAGVTYEEARLAMFPDGRTRNLGSNYTHVRRAFRALGIAYAPSITHALAWGFVTELAIVTCTRTGHHLHWVVYEPKRQILFDPSESRPMHPLFSRLRALSYLAVQPRWTDFIAKHGSPCACRPTPRSNTHKAGRT